MNKISPINNKTEESHDNKVKKKSKFKKFLSSSMAVMVLSVGLAAPMTLRGEETEYDKKVKRVVNLMEKEIEKNNQKIEDNNKKIEDNNKKIEENNKEIEKSKKVLEEAKKEEMEARKELKKNCISLEKWLVQVKNHCSNNECTTEQKKTILEKDKEYSRNCEELLVTLEKGN
jgi:TolA-binding protein